MNRKQFIQSHGATCRNWTWSWSFINEKHRLIIFGAWDHLTESNRTHIFGESWDRRQFNGKKNIAFPQSLEHIRLVESGDYGLMTFSIVHFKKEDESHPAKIQRFEKKLTRKYLKKIGTDWYAYNDIKNHSLPEKTPV
ncbi:MAG: hypothetical protein Q7T21_06585 [Gallionella sp.]|nr:hypothetical protein [Gallionella sp.]